MTLTPTAMLTDIGNALAGAAKGISKLLELALQHLTILQRIAATIDDLTAWLQQPPSSELPDLLRALVAEVATLNTKVASIDAKVDAATTKLDWLVSGISVRLDHIEGRLDVVDHRHRYGG